MNNSFLQLRELEMAEFVAHRQDGVRAKVEQRLRRQEFIGNVLELFFPKLADTLTVMAGGEAIEGQEDYPTIGEDPSANDSATKRLPGPEDRDEIIR
ncbi:hypothetical protein [Lewinella sp. 4G2]|uniref:hypothetical protein n=1 Tax=Lewinella sp. 4G2 TaxID=1803372 RepID=UPI0007B4836B|nr:hypothetical protein [Lewinella sp. 4G2]OAV42655.1 hypothetical protein A3850_015535 [Lewinella sp. 4G2]